MPAPRFARPFRLLLFVLTAHWVLPQPTTAHAQQLVQATIVQIDGDDVVIDAGNAAVSGARAVTVYRALEVRHPVSRKTLRDRFAIGTLVVSQGGQTLSVMRVNGTPAHPFRIGDVVELTLDQAPAVAAATVASTNPATTTQAAAAQSETTASTATAALTEDQEIVRYWYATLTKPPELRARYYQDFLNRFPTSRYHDFVKAEIAYLGQVATAAASSSGATPPSATTQPTRATTPRAQITLLSPRNADEDQAVEIAAHVRMTRSVRSLILHARALETPGFKTFVMELDERGHARATVPAEIVRAPGLAYFIQVVSTDDEVIEAQGSVDSPMLVTVKPREPESAPPPEPTTRVRFTSEIVSFDGTSGRDYFLVNEGDFLYRVRFHRLYGVRLGYGNYQGQGGTVEELDVLRLEPKPAGFTYGFIETELAIHALFGLAFRGTVGLGRPDDSAQQRNAITGGFQMRARIGTVDGAHLILAGEFLPEIGQRAYIGLHYEALRGVPMQVEVVVTDQPVNSNELAVRLIYEVGIRFTDRIAVALRPSYQLRNITHAGPGMGLAATFDW